MSTSFWIEDVVDAAHPCLPGHFPGEPIVPGVLILARVVAAIEAHSPQANIVGARKVRFHTPLRPREQFKIHVRAEERLGLRFDVDREGERIASGLFLLRTTECEAGTACDA